MAKSRRLVAVNKACCKVCCKDWQLETDGEGDEGERERARARAREREWKEGEAERRGGSEIVIFLSIPGLFLI